MHSTNKTQCRFIQPRHEVCEECIDYVCEHTYPCLALNDCSICMDAITPSAVAYMSLCGHAFHRECIQTANSYREVAKSTRRMEERRLGRAVIRDDPDLSEEDRNAILQEHDRRGVNYALLHAFDCLGYTCPYCTQQSKELLTYDQVHILCCNSVMPAPGATSAGIYHKMFDKYKVRLRPTPSMLSYLKDSKELMGDFLFLEGNVSNSMLLTQTNRSRW